MTAIEKSKCVAMADEISDILTLTPPLYKALCDIPREIFAPVAHRAYSLDAQPIGGNQWISSPLTVAKMTLALEAEGIDNTLEIGCGSGYQAAILSRMVHRVFAVERVERLVGEAKKHFANLGISNISLRHDDGNAGWKNFAPFDRILLSACAERIDERLFAQLAIGGILVAPMNRGGSQKIVRFSKISPSEIKEEELGACEFVPLVQSRG